MATVVGLPNVGKSSLINSFKSDAIGMTRAAVAPLPGFTRSAKSFIVNKTPNIALFDTPGIFCPVLDSAEKAFKLALVGVVGDRAKFFDEEALARRLLLILNEMEVYEYSDRLGSHSVVKNFDEVSYSIYSKREGVLGKMHFFI